MNFFDSQVQSSTSKSTSLLHPIYSTYLGFWADSELYDNSETIQTFAIGSLLIALTDIHTAEIYNEFSKLKALLQQQNSNFDNFYFSETILDQFKTVCINAYDYLSSYHIILGDAFLSSLYDHLFSCADPAHLKDLLSRLPKNIFNPDSFLTFSRDIMAFSNYCRRIASLSNPAVIHELMDSFLALERIFPVLFSTLLEEECFNLVRFFADVQTQSDYFSTLISSILVRTDNPSLPVLRYIDHSSLLDHSPCSNRKPSDVYGLQNFQIRVIKDPTADKYDEAQGNRLINVYNTYGIYDAALAEFYFMCTNNLNLGKCKNCGKFFRPLSIASNFCDRPLGGDSKHTCRSTSGRWYSDNRRSNNPAWNEFMKYKSKYNSRTNRNKHLNPPERFNDWKIKASALVDQYENSEISLDTFSKKLKEMDEDMKPLDKM